MALTQRALPLSKDRSGGEGKRIMKNIHYQFVKYFYLDLNRRHVMFRSKRLLSIVMTLAVEDNPAVRLNTSN